MFEELKKASFKKSLFLAVLFIIIGIVLVIVQAQNVFYTIFGYADFAELKSDQLKSQLVEGDLDYAYGCYLELYEKNTKTGSRKTTHLYYAIDTQDEENRCVISIKVPYNRESDMEQLVKTGKPVHFKGQIKKLENEYYYDLKKSFKSYFKEPGMTEEELNSLDLEEFILPYYIELYNNPAFMSVIFLAVFFGGIALIVAGVYRIFKGKSGGFLKKLHEDIRISGYADSYVESDYNSAQNISKLDDIKMGRLMTYYHLGADYRAIPHNKIMWAYQTTITHRTNGIKTGTSYNVVYYIDGYKASIDLPVSNEATALEILKRLNDTCPWIVIGFSDDIKKLFNNNRAEFLQIRYNTVEHNPVEPGFENTFDQTGGTAQFQSSDNSFGQTGDNTQNQNNDNVQN